MRKRNKKQYRQQEQLFSIPRPRRPLRGRVRVPLGLQRGRLDAHPGLLPILRGHVLKDLEGAQDHKDDQGGREGGEHKKNQFTFPGASKKKNLARTSYKEGSTGKYVYIFLSFRKPCVFPRTIFLRFDFYLLSPFKN